MIGFAAIAGGCAASTAPPSRVAGPLYDPVAESVYGAPTPETRSMRVEVEGDGLPSQLAPRHRPVYPDDPREPWSPNYGSVPPGGLAGVPPRPFDPARIAARLDRTPEPASVAAASPRLDADEIIRRAIAEHEMRRN